MTAAPKLPLACNPADVVKDDVATTVMIDCESACSYWPDAIVTQGPSTFHGRFVMDSQQVIWDCTANGTTPGSPATCIVWTGLEFNKTKTLTLPEPQTVVIPDPTYYPVSITAGPLTPWTQATSINITVTAINRPETDSVVETGSITITGIPTQSSSTSATTTGSGSPVSSKDASGANQREVALAGSLGGLVLALIAYL